MITSEIIEITGSESGPTLAIFAGVHGNETAGVLAFQELIPKLKITKGTLFLVFANPPAIEANVRMINKNLNRCFFKGNNGNEYEDIRARELMAVLDQCDALLDIHMFYDPEGLPFVICEDNAIDLAKNFDVPIISTNWTEVEPGGTDGYMYLNGKITVCIECGPISKAAKYKDLAAQSIYQFLQYFNMSDKHVPTATNPKRIIKALNAVHKSSEQFILTDGLHNFDRLTPGQVIATENDKTYTANKGECIIFPHYKARLGEEAYIIGSED